MVVSRESHKEALHRIIHEKQDRDGLGPISFHTLNLTYGFIHAQFGIQKIR